MMTFVKKSIMLHALIIPKAPPNIENTQEKLSRITDELNHLRKINRAILDGQSLEEISELFMNAVVPVFDIFSCRIYMYNENKLRLMVLAEHYKKGLKEMLENKLGIKMENVVPDAHPGTLFYDYIQSEKPQITTNKKEILRIIRAHTNSTVLKGLASFAKKLIKVKSFGTIPLRVNGRNIGLVTFVSTRILSEAEKETINTYMEHISVGLTRKISEHLLIEQEKFSKELLDQLPIGLMVFNEDNTCQLVNKECISNEILSSWVVGKNTDEINEKLKGSGIRTNLSLEDFTNTKPAISKKITESIDVNGSLKYSLNVFKPIHIGAIQKTVAYSVDVTDLVQAKNELVNVQRIAEMGSFEINMNTTNMKFDEFILNTLGLDSSQNELSLRDFYLHIETQHKGVFLNAVSSVDENKSLKNLELVLINQNKEKIDVCINASCFERDNGAPVLKGTIQNISYRKNAARILEAEHKLLNESQSIGMIGSWEIVLNDLTDWNKNTPHFSNEAYRIFGYEPGNVDVSFDLFMHHVHTDDLQLVKNSLVPISSGKTPESISYRIVLNDRKVKHIFVKLAFEYNEMNEPVKLIGIMQDITKQKELETQIASHNRQLELKVKHKTQELSIANQNLDAFNHSVSHDLRVYLRGMEIYTDLLIQEHNETDDTNWDYLQKIKGGFLHMNQMISSMLEFAKSGKGQLDKAKIEMDFLINHCIESLLPSESRKSVDISVFETPTILGDYKLINQVLNNLLSNAIKYSSKKSEPTIKISGKVENNYVVYAIEDNGDGFDMKWMDKLFKPFSRLHSEDEFEGNGIGLATVERIINRHGGSVWAISEKGIGSTFFFKVPMI